MKTLSNAEIIDTKTYETTKSKLIEKNVNSISLLNFLIENGKCEINRKAYIDHKNALIIKKSGSKND